ncbi:hypothetical protein L7F22_052747 [Adiantum nelumboides]|nr:hypothetical protein [Adiantum nelumboides]
MAVANKMRKGKSNGKVSGKGNVRLGKRSNGASRERQESPERKKSKRFPSKHIETIQTGQPDAYMVQDAADMIDDGQDSEDEKGSQNGKITPSSSKAASFLLNLDEKQISRSRAETERLHRKEIAEQRQEARKKGKGRRQAEEEEESEAESTDMEGASIGSEDEDDNFLDDEEEYGEIDSEDEASHLDKIRRGNITALSNNEPKSRAVHKAMESSDEEEDHEKVEKRKRAAAAASASRSTITTGARFGMRSPYEIFTQKKKSIRTLLAREQIARLATDILNDPEVSLGLVKRLAVFTQATVTSPEDRHLRANVDESVRASAILSLCAVFIDILPGYRIRALTAAEQSERVNQELARRREWEQGIVNVYRDYLEMCERISRKEDTLFNVTMKAMCTLAVKVTHFNYRTNLLRSLVSCLSRKRWDLASQDANEALVTILKEDYQGDVSLEIVRLLNRMIKERHFNVNATALDILRHLRLRDELPQGKRATMTTATNGTEKDKMNDVYNKKLKSKDIRKGKGEHLSKKEAKRRKEMKEIEEEMKEAEAEVDVEERERHQTETLKLLFVLYFSVIKAPKSTDALLIATMKGLSLFAHRINIDFFRDLLNVLRGHIQRSMQDNEGTSNGYQSDEDNQDKGRRANEILALHCIVAVLELLNGQGEALNVDLSDIVAQLYTIMIPLCLNTHLEQQEQQSQTTKAQGDASPAQLLMRALQLSLIAPSVHVIPNERLASFISRMCICALHTPPQTSLALIQTAHSIVRRHPSLQTLLDNGEDRAKNGHFDPSSNHLDGLRPLQAGCILWPLSILRDTCHEDLKTRAEALMQEA